jgi:Raf kinase inhibitor-like YbhB/YbcL family protein
MPLTITSPAFRNGEVIPTRHTRDGENLSPPLEWRDAPPETKSFVLTVEDPDAPSGTFRHWALYNIPANATGLPEGASAQGLRGAGEGVNGFRNAHYDGPQSPKRHGPHHYHLLCEVLVQYGF